MTALDQTLENINHHYNINGKFPSVDFLASNMGLQVKTIKDRIKQLEQAGKITRGKKFEITGIVKKKQWLCVPLVGVAA